jgi:GT2 family glycosyltransferase
MQPGKTLRQMAATVAACEPSYPDITTCEGFFFALSRTMLDEIGWFDGIFGRGYCEESDLSMRANYFGWRTVLVDNCYIFHYGRESFGSATRQVQYEKNKRVFFGRWQDRYKQDFERMKARSAITKIREALIGDPNLLPVKWVD